MNIEQYLAQARHSLLDLTFRNRLINFKPATARTLRVVDEIPREVFDFLVIQEKTMQFLPKPMPNIASVLETDKADNPQESGEEIQTDLPQEEASILWEMPKQDVELKNKHQDKYLQTSLEQESLQKRLFYIRQLANSAVEEQGYTILYLALGFLEWKESADSDQVRKSPLILIPVEIQRTSIKSNFKLAWTGEDIYTNISLKAKLSDIGVALPEFEMPEGKEGIIDYFNDVVKSVEVHAGWKVVTDIYLGFFSFSKFVMYKDLDPNTWPSEQSPAQHPLIKHIFDPSSVEYDPQDFFDEDDIDEKLTPENIYHILDADPSQIAAIEDIKSRMNLVVEGPPGTGKSQTIANAIAELLAEGKSVLFVSEKMAALEVVKDRLDRVGLGDFCLELHSRKSNKKEVLQELERTMNRPAPEQMNQKEKYRDLTVLRDELNMLAKILRTPFGVLERSPYNLFCVRESAVRQFSDKGKVPYSAVIENIEQMTPDDFVVAERRLTELRDHLSLIGAPNQNPWYGTEPGPVLPSDEQEIRERLLALLKEFESAQVAINELVESFGLTFNGDIKGLSNCADIARAVIENRPYNCKLITRNEWPVAASQAERILSKIDEYQQIKKSVLLKFSPEIILESAVKLKTDYEKNSRAAIKYINPKYYFISYHLRKVYKEKEKKSRDQILEDLKTLETFEKLRENLKESAEEGKELFGKDWNGGDSDLDVCKKTLKITHLFRKAQQECVLSQKTINLLSEFGEDPSLTQKVAGIDQLIESLRARYEAIKERLSIDEFAIFGSCFDEGHLDNLRDRLGTWEASLASLSRWAQYTSIKKESLQTFAAPIVIAAHLGKINDSTLLSTFSLSVAEGILKLAFGKYPVLARFDGPLHEKKIKRFMELDQTIIKLNRKRLKKKLYDEQPHAYGGASSGSELGILQGEFNRKRKHMPIRKLILATGSLIQKIKPCFMMSPLSIAQFLEPKSAKFDVIIFDEASQVKPADALGSLLRGTQAVVMGDTKQLPPTSFFDHMVDADTDEEEDVAGVPDIESILHLCRRSFPTKRLKWHYRSRHESLIAVSNHEFYDNDLLIYPSAIDNEEHLGLHFHHLPSAIYDRGKSSVNRVEAAAVVKAAIEHYKKYPNKSLGVGTFNIKQQQAIQEEIEFQLKKYPDMEEHFRANKNEHFFVKNLETIQGDERDTIFLSVGFGFDSTGTLSKNFGPINQEGGERRLNVLISRARERCEVFCNFHSSDLGVDNNSPFGLRALKTYLQYAETRNLQVFTQQREETDSPFEDSVFEFVRSHGYEVRKQVGCSKFRIDLAVVDPSAPGRYLLAIECDGAKYHMSPVARDRDRLRQQILEGLGWKIYRLWSTDWYRNRQDAERKLIDIIKYYESNRTVAQAATPASELQEEEDLNAGIDEDVSGDVTGFSTHEISIYNCCLVTSADTRWDLGDGDIANVIQAVHDVVRVEGPVHKDEVVKRVRELWKLKRSGSKIQETIAIAIRQANSNKTIEVRGDFLWQTAQQEVLVRRRESDPSPQIELITDEEIEAAGLIVLKQQYSISKDHLAVEISKLLGFNGARAATLNRISNVVEYALEKGSYSLALNNNVQLGSVKKNR